MLMQTSGTGLGTNPPTMAPSLSLNKSSSSMFPSLSLNKPSSSITSKILNEGKISDGLPRAFVTLLSCKGDNIMGVEGLAKGLRMVKTAYPLVVVFLPGVPEEDLLRLESQGCLLRKVEPASLTRLVGRNGIKFSKLLLWDLDGYEKLVYLDFNVQVFHNIDELFDYPEEEHGDCGGVLYAVLDCFCEKTDNLQDNINLCQKKLYFDDGMFVFEPSKKTFKYLIETLDLIPPIPSPSVVQDFLNMFFKGVYKPISLIYNLNLPMLWNHPEHVVDVDKVKVVHYSAEGSQPWRYPGEEKNMQREDVKLLLNKWWDVYNDESLDYKPPAQEDSLEAARL